MIVRLFALLHHPHSLPWGYTFTRIFTSNCKHHRRSRQLSMTSYTGTMNKTSEFMKITISVRRDVVARANRRAKELGTNRSAWFNQVAERDLDATNSSVDVIARINAVVAANENDTIDFARAAANRLLADGDDTEW